MTEELEKLQEDLDALNVEYGCWKANAAGIKYRAVPDNDRYEVIKRLVEIIKSRGVEKEFFKTSSVKEFIAKFFFPDHRVERHNATKRRGCYEMVYTQIREAIIELWPVNDIQHKPLETPRVIPATVPKVKVKISSKPVYDKPKFVAEDITETPYKGEGGTSEVQVDEEYAKLLGVKTNVW